MPRKIVERPQPIEYLSILDWTGKVDRKLEPDIPEETLKTIYRAMLFCRLFDERTLQLQRQGRIGTFAPIKGQEAAQVAAVVQLKPTDWFIPSFRETAAQIYRGLTPQDVWLFYAGYNEGLRVPDDKHDLPLCVPVASQCQHAVGIAYASKYKGTDEVTMVFHGDGATSEGDFHEAMNFAGVYQLPVIFVCQNNQWAISIPRERQTRSKTIAQKAIAYGFGGVQVDGNDPLAVYVAAQEAIERARSESMPTLIECVTYRLGVHTTADDPKRYRRDEEVKEWEKKDPIPRFEKYLKAKGVMTDEDFAGLREEIRDELKRAWKETEAKIREFEAGSPDVIFDHIYAVEPPELAEQRAYFLERIKREGRPDA